MALEIERKFLVHPDTFAPTSQGRMIKQGYLNLDPDRTVRVRILGDQGWLTIKGRTENATRLEFEYPIPLSDANELLATLCQQVIEKTRYIVPTSHELVWEVDVFHGENAPLIVAEIELPHVESTFDKPEWLGKEVTEDQRYYNSQLAQHPFQSWE